MVTVKSFDKTSDGKQIDLIAIENSNGNIVELINFGAIIYGIKLKMNDGKSRDIVLGYDTVQEYENDDAHLGATIGRCANRIGPFDNTGKPGFELCGKKYYLAENSAKSVHLHGGNKGFDRKVFRYKTGENYVDFECVSPDGDENYPGNLTFNVRFTFDDDNCLTVSYTAMSDKDTVCSFTNHSYFNLDGHGSAKALYHRLQINSNCITEVDDNLIPTGKLIPVKNTPFDFNDFHVIGDRINSDCRDMAVCSGYDHNYVVGDAGIMKAAAVLESSDGAVKLSIFTEMPCVQLYASNFLTERKGKDNAVYGYRSAVCLETQNFPNAVNRPMFPSA
ncbi:MAG: galactose mutarotase, partial [Clostridia bacterium]|nr:galactose mutarotase [Clostridia bacterium]